MQATLTAPINGHTDTAQTATQAAVQSLRAAGSDELATLAQGLHDAEALFNAASSGIDSVALGREPTRKEQRKWDAAQASAEAAVDALRGHPARTLAELAEKARVLAAVRGNDYVDITANEEAIRADLDRLAGTDQGDADDWQTLAARLAAHAAKADEYVAAEDAADEAGDEYEWPTDHIEEGRYVRAALLRSEPPTWGGVGLKAMLLGPYAGPGPDEDVTAAGEWEQTGNPKDWRTWLHHFVKATAELGDADPANADSLKVFAACFTAEEMAKVIAQDPGGYRNWTTNIPAVAEIATILASVRQDVQRLGGSATGRTEWARAYNAAHFSDAAPEPAPELSALMRAATEAVATYNAAPLSDEPGYDPGVDKAMTDALEAVKAYEAQTAGEALAKLTFLLTHYPDEESTVLDSIAADLARWSRGDDEAGAARLQIEERGTGPDLREQLTASGAIRPQAAGSPQQEAA